MQGALPTCEWPTCRWRSALNTFVLCAPCRAPSTRTRTRTSRRSLRLFACKASEYEKIACTRIVRIRIRANTEHCKHTALCTVQRGESMCAHERQRNRTRMRIRTRTWRSATFYYATPTCIEASGQREKAENCANAVRVRASQSNGTKQAKKAMPSATFAERVVRVRVCVCVALADLCARRSRSRTVLHLITPATDSTCTVVRS